MLIWQYNTNWRDQQMTAVALYYRRNLCSQMDVLWWKSIMYSKVVHYGYLWSQMLTGSRRSAHLFCVCSKICVGLLQSRNPRLSSVTVIFISSLIRLGNSFWIYLLAIRRKPKKKTQFLTQFVFKEQIITHFTNYA